MNRKLFETNYRVSWNVRRQFCRVISKGQPVHAREAGLERLGASPASKELNLREDVHHLNVKNQRVSRSFRFYVVNAASNIQRMKRSNIKDADGDIDGDIGDAEVRCGREAGCQPEGERHGRRKLTRQMPTKYSRSVSVVLSWFSELSHAPQRQSVGKCHACHFFATSVLRFSPGTEKKTGPVSG